MPTPLDEIQTPDPETSLEHLVAKAHEHFDDFVILARRKGVTNLLWAYSDATWARGAMDRVTQDLTATDHFQVRRRESGEQP